jgi:O-antigen/teichoic acid export membrane protein
MRKTFVSNLILIIGLNLLIKPFYILGIETEIQNRVGAANFGSYFALIAFSFLINMIPDMGMTNWNARQIAKTGQLSSSSFSVLINLRIFLSALYLVICLLLGLTIGYSNQELIVLSILALNQILSLFVLFFRSCLAGLHLFRKDSILSILDRAILVIVLGYILWGKADTHFEIEWLVYAQTFAYGITFLLALFWVMANLKKEEIKNQILPSTRAFQFNVLKESLPFALMTIFGMMLYRTDSILLERLNGPEDAGHYAMGFRFFEAYNMISFLFAGLLLPIFSKMIAEKKDIAELLSLSSRQLLSATWLVTLFCFFQPYHVMHIFYDNPSTDAIEGFRWLMIGCLMFSMQYIYGTLLTAAGHMRTLIYIVASGWAINIVLNLIFIPKMGVEGVAKINALSHGLILLAEILATRHYFKISLISHFKSSVSFIALTTCFSWWFFNESLFPTIKSLSFTYTLAIFSAVGLSLAVITRILDIKKFFAVMKSRD